MGWAWCHNFVHVVPCQAGSAACSANGVSSTSMSPGGSAIADVVSMRNASGVLGPERKEVVSICSWGLFGSKIPVRGWDAGPVWIKVFT